MKKTGPRVGIAVVSAVILRLSGRPRGLRERIPPPTPSDSPKLILRLTPVRKFGIR